VQLHVGVLVHTKKIGGDLMEDMQFLASIIFVQLFLDKEVLLKKYNSPSGIRVNEPIICLLWSVRGC